MLSALFIARRYLFSVRSHSVVNIISAVSLLSLLTPVAAIILLLSVFNGFGIMVHDMDARAEAELTIVPSKGRIFSAGDLPRDSLLAVDGVEAVSLVLEQLMLFEREGESTLLTVRGVDDDYIDVVPFSSTVAVGDFPPREQSVVLGAAATMQLGLRSVVRDSLNVFAIQSGGLQSLLPVGGYVSEQIAFSGIFYLNEEHEDMYAYAPRALVEKLLRREDAATRMLLRTSEGADVELIREKIQSLVGEEFRLMTRADINPMVYQILRYEKMGIILISFLVMILATFSLMGALSMLIVEREKDIVTLRSLGLSKQGVRQIFTYQGLLIAALAITLGAILGVGLTLLQQNFGIITLPQTSFTQSAYPVDLMASDVVAVCLMSAVVAYALCRIVVAVLIRRIK